MKHGLGFAPPAQVSAARGIARVAPIALAVLIAVAGCKGSVETGASDGSGDDRGIAFGDLDSALTISPADPKITVEQGKAVPTVQFSAQLSGRKVSARWKIDRAALGTISSSGLFSPSGKLGGRAKVTASVGSQTATTTVEVTLKIAQNGATKQNGNPGPGGFGGVGGEGLGPAVSKAIQTTLGSKPSKPTGFSLLYPYDETVWPLGILAPLLQWKKPPQGSGEGVSIVLSSRYFHYKGTFGRPKLLASGKPFVRHPIPQDVWKAATRSAAGGTLKLELTVASSSNAYGPLEQTWKISSATLRGTVYYQSYGTNLAKNYSGAVGGDGKFGGATLAIKGGSTDPVLVAGKSGGSSACRVCHSVAAEGSRMVVQHGDNYKRSSAYDLLNSYLEKSYPSATDGMLGWIGMTPDGKLGLGNAVPLPGGANTGATGLYDMKTGSALTAKGLSSFVTKAGFPMFSPDGKRVAFNFYAGAGNATIGKGDGTKLVMMSFDPKTHTFSKPKQLYAGTTTKRPGWPAFWPTGDAVLFQLELPGNAKEFFATRNGAKGELWWVDLASGKAHALDRLNGTSSGKRYIPSGPNNHKDDTELNYEPTISPIASGGYAWAVFTSRRLYGNTATIDPWWSDPRAHDLTKAPTTKKLWVAALDLKPKPGADPSHPAFYLPAQELLAGNSRGFWVVDPCKADGKICEGGDECCSGFCVQKSGASQLVCGKSTGGCAKEFDKCTQSSDCCDYPRQQCINGRCARLRIE